MVDNRSDREGGFSFPDGVARDCLISVKHTKYTGKSLSLFKSHVMNASLLKNRLRSSWMTQTYWTKNKFA